VALALCLSSISGAPGQVSSTAIHARTNFEAGSLDVFHAVLKLAADNDLPLGIVRFESQSMCTAPAKASYKRIPVIDVFSNLLSSTASNVFYQRGVVEIRPNVISGPARALLSMRFDDFYGPSTTAQGLGIILSGYITSRLHPGQGYAGDILDNTSAEHLAAFHLRNASVEEILDYTVARGTKGMWLASPKTEAGRPAMSTKELRLSVYAYKDDAKALEQLTCGEGSR
jgi:hypothetical protein